MANHHFNVYEEYVPRAIQLLDAWLKDDTPRHVWEGLVKLRDLERSVYRFVGVENASLYELKKSWQRLGDIEDNDNQTTALSQSWLDDFWERNACVLPPQGDFINAGECWEDGAEHNLLRNDGEFIWCGEMSVGCDIPHELWTHLGIVLGAPIPERFKAKRFVTGD